PTAAPRGEAEAAVAVPAGRETQRRGRLPGAASAQPEGSAPGSFLPEAQPPAARLGDHGAPWGTARSSLRAPCPLPLPQVLPLHLPLHLAPPQRFWIYLPLPLPLPLPRRAESGRAVLSSAARCLAGGRTERETRRLQKGHTADQSLPFGFTQESQATLQMTAME
uniref:Uncharacterized protein n=1 Tax=Mustela putorius furo TaxID=9669 RepID=M3Y6S5_MUSPF